MKPETLEELLTTAYRELAEQRETLTLQAESAAAYRYSLETAKAELTLSGTITGKNETERAASARMTLKLLYDDVEKSEQFVNRFRAHLETCERRVEYLRALLRIAELTESKPE